MRTQGTWSTRAPTGIPVAIISYNPLASLWVNCLGLRPYAACCASNTGLSRAALFTEALETLRLCKDATITYFDDRLDNLEDVAEAHPDTVNVHVLDPLLLHTQVKQALVLPNQVKRTPVLLRLARKHQRGTGKVHPEE
jgi:hypothetical protein